MAFLGQLCAGVEHLGRQARHIAADGDVVLVELVDRWRNRANGREAMVPGAGVFEVRDGRFAAVRNYYDGRSLERQLRDEPAARP